MTIKHTPGPWLIAGADKTFVYALGERGTNSFWAQVQAAGPEHISEEEKKANARLIAAAPDLLAALKVAADQLDSRCAGAGASARAVIAKADGR